MAREVPIQVSVVVPVYNGVDTIGACVDSLLAQQFPSAAYEIIVVENGSTDATSAIVQRLPVRLFHSQLRGPAPARNLGIAQSRGDIVAFTDADCVAHPQWLVHLVAPYSDPAVGGVGGAIQAYGHTQRNVVELFADANAPLVNYVSGQDEFLPHLYTPNASYRKALLEQVHGFNPRLLTTEDVDLSWRVQLETCAKLSYAPEAIIYHRHRTSRAALARQYRHYGFGEILLDTLYQDRPGYPRGRRYQLRRLAGQFAALPRYGLSMVVNQIRRLRGQASAAQAAAPQLWWVIESNNIRGKLEALLATRLMTDPQPVLGMDSDRLIARLFDGADQGRGARP